MNFKDYCRDILNEKVTKKEYESVLNSNNIRAGCEFEFYVDSTGVNIDFDEISDQYRDIWEELDDERYRFNEDFDEKEDEIREVQRDVDDLEMKIDGLKEIISNESIEDEADQDYIDGLKKELKDVENKTETYNNEIEVLEGQYPRFEDYEFLNIFDNMKEFFHNLDDKYGLGIDYFIHIIEESRRIMEQEINEMEKLSATHNYISKNLEDILDLDDLSGSIDSIEDLPGFDETPVDLNKGWKIEDDPSLESGGVEIISPTKDLNDLLDDIEPIFDWIDEVGYTNSDVGFHVHLSLKKFKEFDPLKLILLFEEDLIYKAFEERRGNRYARSVDILKSTVFNPEDLKKFFSKKKLDKTIESTEKMMGIHVVDMKDSHVEFRYMGEVEYQTKFEDVRMNILRYAYWLQVACDPDFKWKTYQRKINKEMLKIRKMFLIQLLKYIEETDILDIVGDYKTEAKTIKKIEKMLKGIPYKEPKYTMEFTRDHFNDAIKLFKDRKLGFK